MIKFVELFSGIGGFRYGLERNKMFKCVWANDNNKYANQIYKKNFGKKELYEGNIRTVNVERIPNHELLAAGFPCQAFSLAGKRKGFNDTRGTLFFEIARILEAKRPKTVLLENVKGLLSHDFGRTFARIISILDELGYWVEWQVLNSKNFGVPQNRERVFIAGHLRNKSFKQIFPLGKSNERNIAGRAYDKGISRTVSSRFSKGVGNTESRIIDVLVNVPQAQRIHSINDLAVTLKGEGGGQGAKTGLYVIQSHSPRSGNPKKGGTGPLQSNEYSFALDRSPHYLVSDKIRRLTPIECERLQGFPDNWTKGLSDTQRYKCLGNAVTTNVIQAIGEVI